MSSFSNWKFCVRLDCLPSTHRHNTIPHDVSYANKRVIILIMHTKVIPINHYENVRKSNMYIKQCNWLRHDITWDPNKTNLAYYNLSTKNIKYLFLKKPEVIKQI